MVEVTVDVAGQFKFDCQRYNGFYWVAKCLVVFLCIWLKVSSHGSDCLAL